MIRLTLLVMIGLWGHSVNADTVIAARTIGSNSVLEADDLKTVHETGTRGFTSPETLIGLETNVIIYAAQAITPEALRMPTLIERNSKVALVFSVNGLEITTEGRALGRASHGQQVQVLNLSSRTTVTGIATGFARVNVGH